MHTCPRDSQLEPRGASGAADVIQWWLRHMLAPTGYQKPLVSTVGYGKHLVEGHVHVWGKDVLVC